MVIKISQKSQILNSYYQTDYISNNTQNIYMNNFSFTDETALVTGAAHGIGFSMAAALANAGAKIALNSS